MAVTFAFIASITNERRDANAVINKKLGLPEHRGSGRLAIVGGGPSLDRNIDELHAFDGQVWAVNGTINWCLENGIDAAFYTIDAQPVRNWTYDLSRIKRAVLSIDCDPSLFDALSGAEVSTLPVPDGGPTSAAAADFLSIQSGYTHISFFGCESNFGESTHAFTSHPINEWIVVRVGGNDYRTKPEFLEQAKIISEVIRTFPDFYEDRSGGLLGAMVEHGPDYELIEISEGVKNMLRDKAA